MYKYGVKDKLFVLNICVVYKLLEILMSFVFIWSLLFIFNSTNLSLFFNGIEFQICLGNCSKCDSKP